MDERIQKLQDLLKDETAVKELLENRTPEDAKAFLSENGIEYSLEEVKGIGATIAKALSGELTSEQLERAATGELSEDELEEVAGGFVVSSAVTAGLIIVGTIAGGGGVGVGIYEAIENWNTVSSALMGAGIAAINWFRSW